MRPNRPTARPLPPLPTSDSVRRPHVSAGPPWLAAALIAGALQAGAIAQSPEPVESRIDHLESLYQQRTADDRAPLLRQYIEQLEALRQNLVTQNRDDNVRAVEREIERARNALANGTELQLPAEAEALVDAEDLEAVAAYRRSLPDDAFVLLLPGGFTTSVATTWSQLRQTPTLMGDQTASLGSRAWSATRLPAGDYEVVAALRSRGDAIGSRITARIGSVATASRTVRGIVRNPTEEPLVFLNMGSVTIEEDLEGFPIEVESRSRRLGNEEGGRPVAMLALMLIAHGDEAGEVDGDAPDRRGRGMRRPPRDDEPNPFGDNGADAPLPNPFGN